MTYYTTEKVLEIIKDYQVYKGNMQEGDKGYSSVGVAQYGIEATMPKAQGTTSDVVANEAIKQVGESLVIASMRTDAKYLEDRLYRVEDEILKEILALRMEGHTIRDIAEVTLYSKSNVHKLLVKIAKIIKSGQIMG